MRNIKHPIKRKTFNFRFIEALHISAKVDTFYSFTVWVDRTILSKYFIVINYVNSLLYQNRKAKKSYYREFPLLQFVSRRITELRSTSLIAKKSRSPFSENRFYSFTFYRFKIMDSGFTIQNYSTTQLLNNSTTDILNTDLLNTISIATSSLHRKTCERDRSHQPFQHRGGRNTHRSGDWKH